MSDSRLLQTGSQVYTQAQGLDYLAFMALKKLVIWFILQSSFDFTFGTISNACTDCLPAHQPAEVPRPRRLNRSEVGLGVPKIFLLGRP